ncbi:hypothetical protein K8Q98_00645 [Candidatus Nomurabacteria bacterium]|nr:hypothetical protein [Candidatus Nomurabacteria bacterium]
MQPEDKLKNKVVTTFADDMAGVIESSEGGMIKSILRQEAENERQKKDFSPDSKRNKFFMFASVLFILLAASVLVFLIISRKEIGTVPVDMQFSPIIFTDQTSFLEVAGLDKSKIALDIYNQVNMSVVKTGGVEGIYLTENKKIVNLSRFFDLIKSSIERDKLMFFSSNFLMGSVNQDTRDLFILLPVNSFADAFNVMRTWETKMFSDLYLFFKIPLSSTTNYLLTKDFTDGIIQNKNARVLYDDSNNIVLMYVFLDDDSILITNTENATREIMSRLAGSRVKK